MLLSLTEPPALQITTPKFDFMSRRQMAMAVSVLIVFVSCLSLALQSLRPGLDFTSGHAIRLGFTRSVSTEQAAEALRVGGYEHAQLVAFGSDRELRIVLPDSSAAGASAALDIGEGLRSTLQLAMGSEVTVLGSDYVSARAGADLVDKSGFGVLTALGLVTVYISIRFQFKFAIAALAALAHDVIITLGFLSLFRIQFDFTVLAALMAVIGYSLNDTIIVADRIRENFRRLRHISPQGLINLSISQTLSRTLITSGTTLVVVLVLLALGGEAIRGFALAMTVGIVVGTYSSIYVASAVLLWLQVTRVDLIPGPVEAEAPQ